jgi:hypothetical protein
LFENPAELDGLFPSAIFIVIGDLNEKGI